MELSRVTSAATRELNCLAAVFGLAGGGFEAFEGFFFPVALQGFGGVEGVAGGGGGAGGVLGGGCGRGAGGLLFSSRLAGIWRCRRCGGRRGERWRFREGRLWARR